jgi:hypothetical protein
VTRRIMHRSPGRRLALLAASVVLTGCAYKPPAAWERGALASPAMQWNRDALESQLQEHTWFSKEAANGGAGVGGGGCGCN